MASKESLSPPPSPSRSSGKGSLRRGESSSFDSIPSYEAYEMKIVKLLASSLWSDEGNGWPLKPFQHKDLQDAITFATKVSEDFKIVALAEVRILSDQMGYIDDLNICRKNNCVRGEVLWLRKILDNHFINEKTLSTHSYPYPQSMFENGVEKMLTNHQYSRESLLYCWECWKDNIVMMIRSLSTYPTYNLDQFGRFALNYLGAQNVEGRWLLFFPKHSWMKNLTNLSLKHEGKEIYINTEDLISCAKKYWELENITVGLRVWTVFSRLLINKFGEFEFSTARFATLLNIYVVGNFLRTLQKCMDEDAMRRYVHHIVQTLAENKSFILSPVFYKVVPKGMAMLRKTSACQDMIGDLIETALDTPNALTDSALAEVIALTLRAHKLKPAVYIRISRKLGDEFPLWKTFIETYMCDTATEQECFHNLYLAMKGTTSLATINQSNIPPFELLYMVDTLLTLTSFAKGVFYTTKATMTEWLVKYEESIAKLDCLTSNPPQYLEEVNSYIATLLLEFLQSPELTKSWVERTVDGNPRLFEHTVVRVFMAILMLHLNSLKHDNLFELFEKDETFSYLPREYQDIILCRKKNEYIGVQFVASHLQGTKNPLIKGIYKDHSLQMLCLDDTDSNQTKDIELISMNAASFWDWLINIEVTPNASFSNSKLMKDFLEPCIDLITASIQDPLNLINKIELQQLLNLLNDMNQLREAKNISDSVVELSKRLLSSRSRVDDYLKKERAKKKELDRVRRRTMN